jgi:hypothetical protein
MSNRCNHNNGCLWIFVFWVALFGTCSGASESDIRAVEDRIDAIEQQLTVESQKSESRDDKN